MQNNIDARRIRLLNGRTVLNGPVVYWMDREIRMNDNWALLYAQKNAMEKQVPLLVIYNLVPNFLGGGLRQWLFKLTGLEEVSESLKVMNIPFFLLIEDGKKSSVELIADFCESNSVGMLVTDFSPLRIQMNWKELLADQIKCPLFTVDSHNIVPCPVASTKQEYGAYTLRPKLYKLLSEFLVDFPEVEKHVFNFEGYIPKIEWEILKKHKNIDSKVLPVDWIVSGEKAAKNVLKKFIKNGLVSYATDRNDANKVGQSNLSPYLHYGMIAPQRVVLEILNTVDMSIEEVIEYSKNKTTVEVKNSLSLIDNVSAFLEELIVRRELSDNFCYYNLNYDSVLGFPAWAKGSLNVHKDDDREFLYSKKQLENAVTHDELWNAAQMEMVKFGKMHGYLRMYWAKKILQWTKSAKEAMEIAIYLNDKYELDGRDPNGYAGIAWCIGGVHDRAWFNRPVFGAVRYMARSGCEKKFDVAEYIAANSKN